MIGLVDIQKAMARIRESIRLSPLVHSESLSTLSGNELYLKLENLQRTGSFKERGALNKILTLTDVEKSRGVIAASAGNHAQAVAYHATARGIRSRICMPLATPLVKVSATRGYGAEVVLHGRNYDEAYQEAVRQCEAEGLTFLHPFDDEAVIAGQGTLGLEMLAQNPALDVIIAPAGGGGLLGGLACAVKEINPRIEIVGVEAARLPSMAAALHASGPVTVDAATTIADGIAVRRVGELTLPLVRKYVDSMVVVEEEEIANAILLLLEREKTLAEGAGAAALAAVLQHKTAYKGKRIGLLVCGGNIDVTLLSRIIERGLVKDGRLVRLRIHLTDHPGALRRLCEVIEEQKANIVETMHDRAYYGVNLGDTVIDVTMETRGTSHIQELMAALSTAGYVHERVQ
ncbi:threonine ammonia-lyase [Paludibaculum fermentans]|uniref:threonine ammonia-lyase n=1 Tax=Paludibaculum fermentans TaxID=1473598 RepID=UPI003EB89213